jgi:hypothetical protein
MLLTRHFLHSESRAPRLRVGVLLDEDLLPRPFADVLNHLQQCNFADLVLRVYNTGKLDAPMVPRPSLLRRTFRSIADSRYRRSLMWSLYDRMDARFAAGARQLLASCDISGLVAEVPRIDVSPISKGFTHRFPADAVEAIRRHDLDIILRFGFNIIRGEILQVPRYGIWSYHHGDNDFYRGGPAHFWELVEGNSLSGVLLQILTEGLDAGTVLCKGLAPTEPTLLLSKNQVQPFLLGTTFAIRKMFELHRGGLPELQEKVVATHPYIGKRRIYRAPSNWQMVRFLIPPLVHKAIRRPFKRDRIDHWRIAFRRSSPVSFRSAAAPDLSGFRWLDSPRGRFYADPFLLEREGRVFCFFEDYSYISELGRISCGEVTPECELVDVRPVLEPKYHLSHPYIFEDSGDIFLIPESANNGTVDLYRATSFPHRWEHVQTLLDAPGLDTIIVRRDGVYWMFTSVSEPPGASLQLAILFSPTLTGKYQLHWQTPITADSRYARGAGRIFDCEGVLIRPSQDSSGTYGRAIHFRKIIELTHTTYSEEPLVTLDATPGFLGIHTYDRTANIEVIDGKKRELASLVARP